MIKLIQEGTNEVISDIDHKVLHKYIINTITNEFSNMVENCYYPNVSKNSKSTRLFDVISVIALKYQP